MGALDAPGARLVSSYDRSGGNNDYGNFLTDGPDGWKVLADLKGPGYVSRSWFTGSRDGSKKIRFYFDGETEPSIEVTLDEWCGSAAPLTLPLAGYEPYCWFSWVPVPFRKRLVIMEQSAVADEKLYYQIAWQALPPGQTVESFQWPLNSQSTAALEEVRQRWLRRGPAPSELWATNRLELAGPAMLQELQFALEAYALSSPVAIEQALRSTTVRIYWEGHAAPSVEAPLGALCGSLWSRTRYQSLYFGLTNETFSLRFPMPFQRAARIEISGPVPVRIAGVLAPCPADGVARGYFHAGWKKSSAQEVGAPHTILQTGGSGKYVGCILGVRSLDPSWWVLEGDELIAVDGESSPSWRGTGLEDYFNGGWYYGNALASPLNGVVFKAPFRIVQYRLHPADPVAFSNSFHMVFERGPQHASRAAFESVSFYYLAQPQAADSDLQNRSPHPEPDPLGKLTLMSELNNFERLGDRTAAMDALRSFLQTYPDAPFRELLQQRLENYRTGGGAPPTGQARLGVYANMPLTVLLDGHPVGAFGGDPEAMEFKLVPLAPGCHVLAVQGVRQNYPDWVQVALRYGDDIYGTDGSWKFSFRAEPGWTRTGFDDAGWTTLGGVAVKGPPEEPYIFCRPNEHVGMQSIPWGIRPSKPWPGGARQVFYRKEFTVPDAPGTPPEAAPAMPAH
jgi:hypothetical protein